MTWAGLEPTTSSLWCWCSTNWATKSKRGCAPRMLYWRNNLIETFATCQWSTGNIKIRSRTEYSQQLVDCFTFKLFNNNAWNWTWTSDPLFTRQMLCQLSYSSKVYTKTYQQVYCHSNKVRETGCFSREYVAWTRNHKVSDRVLYQAELIPEIMPKDKMILEPAWWCSWPL